MVEPTSGPKQGAKMKGPKKNVGQKRKSILSEPGSRRLLYYYVGREYVLSFLVAFVFFFFIFFVNQILVLAQKILLKNVHLTDVLLLVIFSIPQFLMYTMPFSSLASASMVIGNFSSQNEILAIRASGIHIRHVFYPIIAISLVLSMATLVIADKMIPYTTELYKDLYSKILQSLPTMEIESYSSTRFGKRIISNGPVEGNVLKNVLVFDDTNPRDSRVISATSGTITLLDIDRLLYKLELDNPQVMITDSSSLQSYTLATAKKMTIYMDLKSSSSGAVNITPSQMSIKQLQEAAEARVEENRSIQENWASTVRTDAMVMGNNLRSLETEGWGDVDDTFFYAESLKQDKASKAFSFYYQYYRSELQKKIALSLACTFLVFMAFPISFLRIRSGRLIGFGISMFIAVAYWFFIYYMNVRAVSSALHPAIYLWAPNLLVFAIGLIMLFWVRK